MSVGSVLSKIPWDLIVRGGLAGAEMVRNARDIKHAQSLVAALERLGKIPLVDVDAIVAEVLKRPEETD